jgi:hypothetical protein
MEFSPGSKFFGLSKQSGSASAYVATMTTPSMGTEGEGDQGGSSPTGPPPDYDGIEFDTFFNNRDPGGEKRDR